jgi:hypothetical protein
LRGRENLQDDLNSGATIVEQVLSGIFVRSVATHLADDNTLAEEEAQRGAGQTVIEVLGSCLSERVIPFGWIPSRLTASKFGDL